MPLPPTDYTGAPGWRQFAARKTEMLAAYDDARLKARGHRVQTHHGNVAEGLVRTWLEGFLPRRFGVASGFIVPEHGPTDHFPHYEVVIYDQLVSPTLWHEDVPGAERRRALPAEHVLGVIEVKSALTKATAHAAVKKLGELTPLLGDGRGETPATKRLLHQHFVSAAIFLEWRASDDFGAADLAELVPDPPNPAFFGGAVFRAEGLDPLHTGQIRLLSSTTPMETNFGGPDDPDRFRSNMATSASKAYPGGQQIAAMLSWAPAYFSVFAFDLLALLQGTYRRGYISSGHGLAWQDPERHNRP